MRRTKMPPLPLTGGCQCGAVRYAISAVPRVFYLCHCSECQTQTSSAFGESLRCDPASVVVTGTMKTTRRVAESGTVRLGDFCPACGVRIQHRSEGDPGRLNVKAGTLDDPSWLVPAGHIWTRSRQAFVTIGADELSYPEGPDDGGAAMAARWREMLGQGG
ncbi:GFA family protein [Aurantimonas sp. 22II-16-19i]|uniref:GFA family protein n=1 Tax=Aurantimonas sp. 22II-16-19i TaxID=1317114 RepID=UPI0009F7BF79|nr:GFA family protein [Aurantimonas sp. 22II-16-19i]ORE90250.1 glutathione-dependent formaldehyde-activating protein [Aurantimonas sp. 22II-16-19i]